MGSPTPKGRAKISQMSSFLKEIDVKATEQHNIMCSRRNAAVMQSSSTQQQPLSAGASECLLCVQQYQEGEKRAAPLS